MKNFLMSVFLLFILTGCGAVFTGYGEALKRYDTIYVEHKCKDSFVDEKIKSKDDPILWTELGGSLKRDCKDYNTSNEYFDKCEDHYKSDVDLEGTGSKILKNAGSTLTNDNALAYEGNVYEAIMVNTYKGLNFMSLGQSANARVEFNRALDRQRRARYTFAKNIKEAQEKLKKENKEKNKEFDKKKSEDFAASQYTKGLFKGFEAYPDFVNPFTTYISALFFISQKDYAKARDLLKESIAMNPKSKAIRDDFRLVNAKTKGKDSKKYIWLIYENGKSLAKNEFSINLPFHVITANGRSKMLFFSAALPTLQERTSSYEHLSLNGSKTKMIADMDRVIKTEFKVKLPLIITKTVARTIVKLLTQSEVSNQNPYAGLAVGLFNVMTNKADVRSWLSLPKNFQLTRVENTGKVSIKSGLDELRALELPKDKNAILYLKSPAKGRIIVHKMFF